MSITPTEVMKIAHLARMSIHPDDVERYAQDLSGILDLVAHMNQIDVQGVEPMAHPLDMSQRLRADLVTEPNQRELLQRHAPAVENGLFLVPKVIE
ncbi:MAG: aspartyl/glutamyl-tRNA(Asn/Gln) amidotransferase subunit C [Gammaproteobacteria bacterium 28-57-27]|nr:MAG: aspartyl/glutamyl-tRNA(Asn/Gln) amidotransferase subunit C [Gammaproteobacteria bacterium 28-57-27]